MIGGFSKWQPIDKHLAYTTYALVSVRKVEKRIMLITARDVVNISQESG